MRFERMQALAFVTLASSVPGCITVNSPLFPGPLVIDRSCPQGAPQAAWRGASVPDTTPTAPLPGPAPVTVPRLELEGPEPIEMSPAGRSTKGGGRSRRLMAGES